MSVQTTADAHVASAREHLQSAISELSQVVTECCAGSEEFTPLFIVELHDGLNLMLRARAKLHRKPDPGSG